VDAMLGNIVQAASSKNLPFCMDAFLEQVLQFKVVAMESRHELAGYFFGRFQSLKEKLWFQRISFAGTRSVILLRDKEQ